MLAAGALLAQIRPADTLAQAAFTAQMGVEITAIAICNSTGSAATFRLHHDQGGSTYDIGNALYYDTSIAANSTLWIRAESMGAGIQMDDTDSLGVRSSVANALTFSFYGQTEKLADRVRGRESV